MNIEWITKIIFFFLNEPNRKMVGNHHIIVNSINYPPPPYPPVNYDDTLARASVTLTSTVVF